MPSLQWNEVKQTGTFPTPRVGHTITTVNKFHYMFGGLDPPTGEDRKVLPKNDVYVLRLTSSATAPFQCEWTLKQCTGDLPMARTFHAATKIQDDRIMIFGGYYTSKLRFNDTFLLKTTTMAWSQPPNQRSVGEPTNSESKIGAPEPRANHSLTFHRGKCYVFGGHGGSDYRRIAFNDLYCIDTESF
jgi:dynein heavy chain